MREGQVEVLAPAGSFESMKAAIGAGADAVYIGGSRFGARAYADNLDQEKMLEAIDYAHVHGVSLYMTVNTLIKEEELGELPGFLKPYYEQGVDGVIVQDLGAVSVIRRCFPDLPVHASTQMTITGVYGARILADLGVKRVVAARELSLEEILRIHQEVPIEIEAFVHGALCYCYSGQCLLSSFIGGRSGNRGRCAQPCRLPYVMEKTGQSAEAFHERRGEREGKGGSLREESYLLSMKDLCTLELLPDLVEAGIHSLKIEGRMKSPRYTAGVVRAYRKYVDRCLEKGRKGYRVDPADRQELLDLFDRGGFTQGYYRQHNGPDMIAVGGKPAFRQGNQNLFEELDRLYVETEKKEPVEGRLTVKEGRETVLELRLGKGLKGGKEIPTVTVRGQKAETARNQSITREQLARQMKKTGSTPFEWKKLDICLEGQAFLPVQALNELRRRGLEQLRQAMTDRHRRMCGERPVDLESSDMGGRAEASRPEVQGEPSRLGGGAEVPRPAVQREDSCSERGAEVPKPAEQGEPLSPGGQAEVSRSVGQTEISSPENQAKPGSLKPELHVLLSTEQGFSQVLNIPEVVRVLMEADGFGPKTWRAWAGQCHAREKNCVLAMPMIFRRQAQGYFDRNLPFLLEAGFDGILVRSLEEIGYLRNRGVKIPIYGDHNLYSFNGAARDMLTKLGCKTTTFPLELNSKELERLGGENRELIGYGFLPAMVSAQCVRKNVSGCSGRPERLMMRDRTGKRLPVENHCAYCYNIIYNPFPLSLIDQMGEIARLAPEAVRLQFTGESGEEIQQVAAAWAGGMYGQEGGKGHELEAEAAGRKSRETEVEAVGRKSREAEAEAAGRKSGGLEAEAAGRKVRGTETGAAGREGHRTETEAAGRKVRGTEAEAAGRKVRRTETGAVGRKVRRTETRATSRKVRGTETRAAGRGGHRTETEAASGKSQEFTRGHFKRGVE